jgi:hypothetical protein
MGANDEDLANLINEILDVNFSAFGSLPSSCLQVILQDLNTALNTLVPKLGLDGLLTPVDTRACSPV